MAALVDALVYMLAGVAWFLVSNGPANAAEAWGADRPNGLMLATTLLMIVMIWPIEIGIRIWMRIAHG